MASTKTAILLPKAIFFVTLFVLSTAFCPAYYPAMKLLQPMSGSVKHDEYYKSNRWCRWAFPVFASKDHVILIKLTSMSLYESGCAGSFKLTGLAAFCRKPTNSCFIYASPPLCNPKTTFELVQNENCTNTYWIFDEVTTRDIRFRSTRNAKKSFSLDYKYFSCKQDLTTKSAITNASSSDADALRNLATPGNETAQPINSGVPSGTFAGVIVLFILLLTACLAFLVLMYRRLRRLKSGSGVPRVQYELAKPRDITVLHLSHVEQTNDSTNFVLHGEHRNDLRQEDAIPYQEGPAECSYSYSVDANYGDDTAHDYNSFTSDESDHVTTDNAACEYATIDKRRAATSG